MQKSPADQAGLFHGCCDHAVDSCNAALDQTIRATFSDAAFEQTIRTTFSNAAFDQTIRTTFGNTAFEQTIRTAFGNAAFEQTIRTTFGNAAFEQTIRTTFGNTAFDQTIRTTFSQTAFDQLVRAAFSDQGVSRRYCKSVNCENRESDAEKGLAFHDRVLQKVVCLSGADVTPRSFYENFIDVMVNIDADDVCQER
jgi:hypothetical protein